MFRTTHTFLCDAVNHWTKHQDVCAAIRTSSQAAVAAETCGTKYCQATDTLVIAKHKLYISLSLVVTVVAGIYHTSQQQSSDGGDVDLLRGPEPVSK